MTIIENLTLCSLFFSFGSFLIAFVALIIEIIKLRSKK